MLRENIIKPSRSPYNSSVLVVPTKGQNEVGSPKHRHYKTLYRTDT